MADIGFADNIRETFSSTGTTITLAGAVDTFRAFSAACVNGDTIYAAARKGSEFSFGKFTWGTGGTLTQTTVLYSTNGNAAVSFSSGTGEVISDVPAALLLALAYMAYASSVVSVGPNRATNPTLKLDFSAASAATGLKITAAAAAGGVALAPISSGSNEDFKVDGLGSGKVRIGVTSTGIIELNRQAQGADGSVSLPEYSFINDPDCGFYRIGANNIGLALNGAKVVDYATTGESITGTLTVSGLITATAGQIAFPAAQNASAGANTLDDYEEGDSVPVPTGGSGTFTTVSAALKYTKIGRTVLFNCLITITTNGTAGSFIVLPLPFTCGAQTAACAGSRSDTGTGISSYVQASTAQAIIFKYDATYPGATGASIIVSASYDT